jgi:DNA-binding NarL/FixJ family response regulator
MSKAPDSSDISCHPFLASFGELDHDGSATNQRSALREKRRRLSAPLSATLSEVERTRLIDLDAAHGQRLQLATLWSSLRAGQLHVSKVFQHRAREYMLLEEHQECARQPYGLDARQARMLERLLSGSSQKAIGIDLGVCPSTVSMSVGTGLDRLGLRCSVSRLPLVLYLVVLSGCTTGHVASGCISDATTGQRLISVEWPKHSLLCSLSQCEREVAELLVDGLTAREIAAHRSVSPRTIANQLASVFTKFRLSGRIELMAHLASSTLKGETLKMGSSALSPIVH